MYRCKISVRNLVEFVYQCGDLVYIPSSIERANLGSRIHRELQTKAKGNYAREVFLKLETKVNTILFEIEGRADGIRIEQDNTVTIEEIKTTSLPYESIDNSNFVHFAQAYCYGYMYMVAHAIQTLRIQVTYYQIETKQIKCFQEMKSFKDLHTFYMQTLQHYVTWANLSKNIKNVSIDTLRELSFPFPHYHPGQRTLATGVYKTILDKDILFAQAPTGIGKTISTIFPALKAIGEKKAEKIFYLCAKTITTRVAYASVNVLYKQGAHFKTLGITAKDKICFLEERNCDPMICPYAKGYYDRSKDALYELLQKNDFLHKDVLIQIAQKYTICPFELSLEAAFYADIIIADYNYVFDPRVFLKRFFMEKGAYVLLIDEAHNLVDRAREMYSAAILESSFLKIKASIPKDRNALLDAVAGVNQELLQLKKQWLQKHTLHAQKEPIRPLLQMLSCFSEQANSYLQSEHNDQHDQDIKELYFQVLNYLKISEYYDEHFITWMHKEQNDLYIKQFCMNPHNPLRETLKKGIAAIFFSATLSPIDYFECLLGGNPNKKRLSLPSIFSHKQRKCIINDHISIIYRNREASISPILTYIHSAIQCKDGNYIVFCPSYIYMEQLSKAFQKQYPALHVSTQKRDMSEQEKQAFLQHFDYTEKQHLFFCVLGGMFSEGIDLVGEKLIGTIIIGVGLPQINPQQDMIKNHFDQIHHMGYAYSYQFPGMNKVLQAAGRVHRTPLDKGIIIFIDERFSTPFYQCLFPDHMKPYEKIQDPQKLQTSLLSFWSETE